MINRRGIKRWIIGLLGVVTFICLTTVTFASVPKTIKVGLESIGKNKASIVLYSDENMAVGYYSEQGFVEIGKLDTRSITLKAGSVIPYDTGLIVDNYLAAAEIAGSLGAVPVAIPGGLFKIYSLEPSGGTLVTDTSSLVEVYDEYGTLIMFTTKQGDLVFCGYNNTANMPLTKVGSTNWYRGAIGVAGTTGLTAYDHVFVEEYLYGVVPKEMSASWPIEALKAQAVAARSIAAYQYNRYTSSGYNVVDTTSTQAYGGYNAEKDRTTQAVIETTGEVIKYNGNLAEAVYFSTSGGVTESAKEVWGTDIAYLQSVKDIYETTPSQPAWSRAITLMEVDACLAKKNINIGNATGLAITSRSNTGRVKELTIFGTNGSYVVTKDAVRSFFSNTNDGSLKSTFFSFYGPVSSGNIEVDSGKKEVTVLSAEGSQKVSTNGLVAKGEFESGIVPERMAVVSADGLSYIDGKEVIVGGNSSLGLETVTSDFTVYGAGYGHGVGMSQSGARGMAMAGFSYDQILKYYYTGVTVEQ